MSFATQYAQSRPAASLLNLAIFAGGLCFACVLGEPPIHAQPPVAQPTLGPLKVSASNPRYFADRNGRIVLLRGSHVWNNVQDMGTPGHIEEFDYTKYLDFLQEHGHNYTRLWRWELPVWGLGGSGTDAADNSKLYHVSNHPWPRTGKANAADGLPQFDLSKLDETYFTRLRERVQQAQKRGIYVSIMLFEGWALQHMPRAWNYHPFHRPNNVQGLEADTNGDGLGLEAQMLGNPAVQAVQLAYVQKVVETLQDCDNVLYEIVNECGSYSKEWQYHWIKAVQALEGDAPIQHPVGMTFQYSRDERFQGTNALLFASPASWISPNPDAPDGFNYRDNPPLATGEKVILLDTDHLWGIGGNPDWAWKSFFRGHQPVFMDPYDNAVLGTAPPESWEPLRHALGRIGQVADRIDLKQIKPRLDLTSSAYCLASSSQFAVYSPEEQSCSIDLSQGKGQFTVDWLDCKTGTWQSAEQYIEGGGKQTLTAPFPAPWVAVLQRREDK